MSEQRGAKVQRICKHCGGLFMARVADVKRGWGRFCSKSCKASHQEYRTNGQYQRHKSRDNSVGGTCPTFNVFDEEIREDSE
jgi:hypothetical protein